jgi:hypothetical protein
MKGKFVDSNGNEITKTVKVSKQELYKMIDNTYEPDVANKVKQMLNNLENGIIVGDRIIGEMMLEPHKPSSAELEEMFTEGKLT